MNARCWGSSEEAVLNCGGDVVPVLLKVSISLSTSHWFSTPLLCWSSSVDDAVGIPYAPGNSAFVPSVG